MAADVIRSRQDGRLLLVNPNYKSDWDLRGHRRGQLTANRAAARELREELGVTVQIGPLLAVDWMEPHGPWDDTLVFGFEGGTLSAGQVGGLRITDDELSGFRFCSRNEAAQLLRPYGWQRAANALDALTVRRALYFHRATEPSGGRRRRPS